ncbi:iron complex outermembrane receptor protein [Pseudoxanthomonas japonensis]|uniref:TonB-dependent siderophore receptor n=1 Tax=Pseudoxanthomonas TaxID=83618 RepID=UPI000781F880|nr:MULTISPECIES: TonB-dependent siderophore receptor [Pseudoxanthomonas]MBA3930508.1 TonB-dependent siderophore receptor [Xanthomonas sp.]MBL8255525.1 TonB-dependent siderophore receptor [Pseudoxanthomonas mexicana]MDR7067238.1 iron complex outermembrane receptor protein [Pseudoxanthomonas japonensis]
MTSVPRRAALRRPLSFAVAIALAAPLMASAQSSESDATTLDTVRVQAPIPKDTGTATKTNTPLAEVPQSVSIITSRDLQDRGLHAVDEAMWYVAGASGGVYGMDTRSEWLLVRGFQPARYLDGLALPTGTWSGQTRIEPYGMERIEVLKGPSSVNYGAMPPGGLVNYVTKRPDADMANEVEVQVGSNDMKQVAFDVGGALNDSGTLLYRLTGLARNSDNFVDYIQDDRYYFAPALTWKPDEANELTVLARWQKADTKNGAGFLPSVGTLLPNPNGQIKPSLYTGEPNTNDYVKTIAAIGYDFRHDFGGDTVFQQNVRFEDSKVDPTVMVVPWGYLGDNRTLYRYTWSIKENAKTFGIDNNMQWRFATGAAEHTLLAGLDYRRLESDYSYGFGFNATGLDAFNPVYGTMPNVVPTFTGNTLQKTGQLGLYLQDQIKINHWLLTIGGRQDWVGTDTNGSRQSDDQFSGRVGVTYLFDNGFAPYVSWGQSFEVINGTEAPARGGKVFDPSTGEQVEVGVKYQPASGNVLLTAAAYEIKQNNVNVVDPVNAGFTIQQGQYTSRGVELEGRWNIARNISVYGAYAYIDSEATKTTEASQLGKQIPLQPKQSASLGGNYTITSGALSGLGFGAGVRYVGDHYGDAANVWRAPSHTLFDASAHYDFGYWRFQLNVQNLSDKQYISTCNTADWCYYGYPRTITATARYNW